VKASPAAAKSNDLFGDDSDGEDILAPPTKPPSAAARLLTQRESLFDDDEAEEAAVAAAAQAAREAKAAMSGASAATYSQGETGAGKDYISPASRRDGWMEGYFTKRSGAIFTEWKTRWLEFNLKEATISYYSRKGEKKPVAVINIRNATVQVDDTQGMEYCFLVVTAAPESKKHYICAQDATEMQDWMDAILHYMSQDESPSRRKEAEKAYTPKEKAVADQLEKFKEAIMDLKDHMGESGGRRDTINSDLMDTVIEAHKTIQSWIQRPDIAQNDHLLFELLFWNDEVNAAVGLAGPRESKH